MLLAGVRLFCFRVWRLISRGVSPGRTLKIAVRIDPRSNHKPIAPIMTTPVANKSKFLFFDA